MPDITSRPTSFPEDNAVIKRICDRSSSPQMRHGFNYIRFAVHHSPGKCVGRVYDNCAFFFGTQARTHFRLILFAVDSTRQRQGIGTRMLDDLARYARENSLQKITFRTSMFEPAVNWWEQHGAKVAGVKGDDYELEIAV